MAADVVIEWTENQPIGAPDLRPLPRWLTSFMLKFDIHGPVQTMKQARNEKIYNDKLFEPWHSRRKIFEHQKFDQ